MPVSIEINIKNICRFVWVALSLAVLQFGMGIYIADISSLAEDTVFILMLFLSFPSGAIMCVFMDPPGIEGPLELSIMWLTGFIAGYLQWFVFVPSLFGRSMITLGLSKPQPMLVTSEPTPRNSRPKSNRKRKRSRVIPAFDQYGQTPIERAINSPNLR